MAEYSVLPDEDDRPSPHLDHHPSTWKSTATTALAAFTLGILLTLTLTLILTTSQPPISIPTPLSKTYSPAHKIYTPTDLLPTRFDGRLRNTTNNPFRGAPNPTLDAAWDEITFAEGGLIRLSKDDLARINVSEPSFAAEYTADLGGGYIAGIEVLHQLHCLNMLRKATYLGYYLEVDGEEVREWRGDWGTWRVHLDHCIDMLRQKLMCDPDLGMITYVWAKGMKQVFPDFNTVHMCRPYSKVLDWARENYVHPSRNVADIVRAPGAKEKELPP